MTLTIGLFFLAVFIFALFLFAFGLWLIFKNLKGSIAFSVTEARSYAEAARVHATSTYQTATSLSSEGSLIESMNRSLADIQNKFIPTYHFEDCPACLGSGKKRTEVPAAFTRLITDALANAGCTTPKPDTESHTDTPAKRSRR